MNRLFSFIKRNNQQNQIIIVSGLPRSGTSLMMNMLVAGGIQPITDNLRKADYDNPKGYYEFERVKKLKEGDYDWLPEAQGKVVKIISALLPHLPPTYQYKVLFMERNIDEVLASQRRMLVNRNEDTEKIPDVEMARLYQDHGDQVLKWMNQQANLKHLKVSYNALLENPIPQIELITHFLGTDVDKQKMAGVIDVNLYRQRK